MLSYLFILSCIVLASAQQQQHTCSYDYECGNNVPYGYCNGGESDCTDTLEGFGINNASIYYAQYCRTNEMYGNYTFKRIPINGGVPVDIYSRQQIPSAGNPSRILGLLDNYLFFDILLRQPGRGIKDIDVTHPVTEGSISTNSFPQSVVDIDPYSTRPATYLCTYNPGQYNSNYTIERHSVFPAAGQSNSEGTLYTIPSDSGSCGVLRRYADVDLFFTKDTYTINGTTSYFYRGTITCSNCALPQPFFSVPERVIDLDIFGNYCFYGTDSGLYRVNLDGTGNVKLSTQPEKASAVNVVNNRVIYNNGMDIRAVNFDGRNNVLLSLPKRGTCACRPGFTGANCGTCNGQVQWQPSYPSRPLCVGLSSQGVPTSCYADYQCGNPPFTACYSNKCTCFNANFTGPRCDVCEPPRQVSWSQYGYPSCA